jgi:hypothetical protein
MSSGKLHKFMINGFDAILLDGRVEVSVPTVADASDIMIKLGNGILDKKLKSLRINLPNKIIFVSAHDNDHVRIRAEEADNKKTLN